MMIDHAASGASTARDASTRSRHEGPADKACGAASAGWPVVVLTTFFPSATDPQRTVFVKNLVAAMRKLRCTTVVAPVPMRPWLARRHRRLPPRHETIEGIPVVHPRFVALPGLDVLTPLTYAMGVHGELRRLRRDLGRFVLHAHCAYPDGVAAALLARWLDVPCVVTAHGSDINVYGTRATLRRQLSWALGGIDGVVAVSKALAGRVRALSGTSAGELECIPCAGFDPAVFGLRDKHALREPRGVGPHSRAVVFVGQLVAVKQVDYLVSAWAALAKAGQLDAGDRLIVIGDGPKMTGLRAQVEAAGIGSQVRFTGALPQREVADWIAASDLLVLPSRSEGTPNVVVEALACGVPVVASNVGGIPELIMDGGNGFLVPPGDTPALAAALIRAFTHPWDRAAVRRSVEHLTWDRLARRNLELIDRISSIRTHAAMA
jgi:glycosyltransferase involved in cell wall biosynthesis